jgi:hypothetical protein
MLKTKKISNAKVIPIVKPQMEDQKVAGAKYIKDAYANIGIVGAKMTGKTSCLATLLKVCAGKNTNVIIFASTVHIDDTYKHIIEMLEKKKCNVTTFTGLIDDEGNNALEDIMEELKNPAGGTGDEPGEEPADEQHEMEPPPPIVHVHQAYFGPVDEIKEAIKEEKIKEREEKKKRKKILYPELILVYDDLASELRNKFISRMLVKNRHFKCKNILLCHSVNNLTPESRRQLQYLLLMKGQSEEKLKNLYTELDISIEWDKFYESYKFATKDKYNFLYIDLMTNHLRKNFNVEIEVPEL